VDELNAALGLLRLHLAGEEDAMVGRIQNDLFDLGADLCVPGVGTDRLRLAESQCLRLEREVAEMNAVIPALSSFVLPGGSVASAHAHLGPHGRPPRRAAGGGARRRRAGEPGSGALPEPPVGPPLRAEPPLQRQRRARRHLDAGGDTIVPQQNCCAVLPGAPFWR
jgi:hypothetical protein